MLQFGLEPNFSGRKRTIMWDNRLLSRCQIHGGETVPPGLPPALCWVPLRNGRDPPSGGMQFGLGQGTQAGRMSVPHTIPPPPQHLSMGPQHAVTTGDTRPQVHVKGQLFPKASAAWTLPSGTFPLNPLDLSSPWQPHLMKTSQSCFQRGRG